jgi:hypothetical protein
MRTLLSILLGAGLLVWGCGKLPEPTTPDPVEDPGPVAPAPAPPVSGPAPDPTPTPVLGSPSSNPTPDPSDDESPDEDPSPDPTPDTTSPPDTSGCGAPTPPAISRVNVKIYLRGPNAWTLDSTPLVGPDADYCASIGFTDGRSMCPVRPEGHPERVACETWAVGTAVDTGRPGPTWRHDGSLCTGVNCENHPDNQYFVRAFANGSYQACASNGACGAVDVNR